MQGIHKKKAGWILCATLSAGILLHNVLPVQAVSPIKIFINGRQVISDVAPVVEKERTMVPIRVVSENLGKEVQWDAKNWRVLIGDPSLAPEGNGAVPGKQAIRVYVDGRDMQSMESYQEPIIVENRTLVPLRAIGEALGMEVEWDQELRHVLIADRPADTTPINPPELPQEPVESADSLLLKELASYNSNLKMMDGTVINSKELLNKDASAFSAQQLEILKTYRDQLSKYPQTVTLPAGETIKCDEVSIIGPSRLTASQINNYMAIEAPRIKAKMEGMGREFIPFPDVADLYIQIGAIYGIRGDIAYFQAVKETGYFQFTGSVRPEQNNYCGLSATGRAATGDESLRGADPGRVWFVAGAHGAFFDSPATGVEAHIQHLYAYAANKALPAGRVIVDPRYSLVSKGIAPTWQNLNARWAVPGTTYGQSILNDYYFAAVRANC